MVWTPIGHVASYLAWLCKLLAESSSYHFSSDVTGQGSKREGECFHSLPEYWAGEKLCLMNSMTLLHVLKASCFFPHIFVLATACSRSAINVRRNPANLVTNTVREWECKMWSFLCSLLWQLFFFVCFLGLGFWLWSWLLGPSFSSSLSQLQQLENGRIPCVL